MTPVKKFMVELYLLANSSSKYGINPGDDEEYVINDSVALEMKPLPKTAKWVHFISIRAFNPGKGEGNKAMTEIMKLADKSEVFLIGKINPYDTKVASKKRLQNWYSKYGCQPFDDIDGIWVRPPRGKKVENLPLMDSITRKKINEGLSDYDYAEKRFTKYIFVVSFMLLLILFIGRNKA
jgi:hypothetical protein